jgi:hypothetical protein
MTDKISEEGRQQPFAHWEQLGLEQVKEGLLTGGLRVVGGPYDRRHDEVNLDEVERIVI